MRYKGFIVPRGKELDRVKQNGITRKAKVRLAWMDYYQRVGNARLTCRHFGIAPDTFYRWKRKYCSGCLKTLEDDYSSRRPHTLRHPETPPEVVERIRELREIYPRWGKEKIAVFLKREGSQVSVSTVGRTIRRLKDREILKEPPPNFISSKKRYVTRQWAVRKPKDFIIKNPGDLIQVDTLDIRPIPGVVRKQFTSRDCTSKWDVLEVFGHATAHLAAQFLDTLLTRTPFPVTALQIDGGSEFKGEFEAECQRRNIKLFVLPPRSPKLNGCVERSNRTHTEEFYEVHDFSLGIDELNQQLKAWETVYNTIRPHQALGYLTPLEYIQRWKQEACVRVTLN
jgi:transposase InsO family protein